MSRKIILLSIVVVIITSGFLVLKKNNLGNQSIIVDNDESDKESKEYVSEVLHFRVEYDKKFSVNENLGSITFSNSEGEVLVNRNGTNFDNLDSYLKENQNHLSEILSSKEEMSVNGLDAVSGVIGNERIYFIYVSSAVYTFSTDSENLYEDLDQIAKSFEYIP